MIHHRLALFRVALLAGDAVLAIALFATVSMARLGAGWQGAWLGAGGPWWLWAIAYGVLWALAEWLQQLDQVRSRWTFRGELLDIARAVLLAAVAVFSLLYLVHAPDVSRLFLVALFASQFVVTGVERWMLRGALAVARSRHFGTRFVLVLGTGDAARRLARHLDGHPVLGYRVIGHLGLPTPAVPRSLGSLDEIERVIHERVVDEFLAVFEPDEAAYVEPIASLAQQEGKRLRLVLAPGIGPVTGGRVEAFAGHEILTISNGPDRVIALTAKRVVDVVVSGIALMLLAPVFALVAVALRLEDGGPVFFRQTRIGLHGRPFAMVKLRTMVPDAEARLAQLAGLNELSGPVFKIERDPRVTAVGRFLRRTSIDEMPQFYNVLRGQMSLVGPRPPLPGEVTGYDLWHRRRLSMKPGITGLWQVSARLEPEFDRWVELDLRYIDRWSLWLDLKIMLRTVPAMITGR